MRTSLLLAALLVVSIPPAVAADDADRVTQGALRYTLGDELRELPLEHTDVRIAVAGPVAEVTVTQVFANPLADPIEAVYVFPLPDRAAVDAMAIRVGERLIAGEIHRREEARQIYQQARAEGRLTGLLDQERDNVFTQRLANLLPGERVEVEIHYVEDLRFDRGTWTLAFPTVVGPRYIPGRATGRSGRGWSPDTDRVPDASRITPPVLTPGTRSGHDVAVHVELDPGFQLHDIASSSHEIVVDRRGRRRAAVTLSPRDRIPNKDFVLSWSTASEAVEPTLLAHRVGEEGYLTLILQPPAQPRPEQVVAREVVFVVDSSGSMAGEPIAACKQLVRKALRQLRPDDTFRLIRFGHSDEQLAPEALPATPEQVERALSFLDGMRGSGGTEMLAGVRAALDAPSDPARLRMVLFLTDGFIGNEAEIVAKVSASLGSARVFSLGVGSSVNRYLLDRLAEAGRGVAEYLRPGESPDALVARFAERIAEPVFTQLELDWGGLAVSDVEPASLPDLFAGRPLLVHARYAAPGAGTVTLRGWAGAERVEIAHRVRLPHREEAHAALAQLWARARIARLEMDRMARRGGSDLVEQVTALALRHRLMTAYTSFVAVDRSEVRTGGDPVTVDQAVPMPEGVSHEGVFGRGGAPSRPAAKTRMVPIPDPTPDDPEPVMVDSLILGVPEPPPLPAAEGPLRYVVGGNVTQPEKLTGADPVYPRAAVAARVEGAVVLACTIARDGTVRDVRVERGLGFGLTEAARDAVRGWRFTPATVNGRPVEIEYVLTVRFLLHGGATAPPAPVAEPAAAPARVEPVTVAPAAAHAALPVNAARPEPGSLPVEAEAPAPVVPTAAPRLDVIFLARLVALILLVALLGGMRWRRRPRRVATTGAAGQVPVKAAS